MFHFRRVKGHSQAINIIKIERTVQLGKTKIFFRGNKGALRIPLLSFQYLRRPGCTAQLLCFQTVWRIRIPSAPPTLFFFSTTYNNFRGALRGH